MRERLIAGYWRRKIACREALENFAREEKGASDIVAIILVIVILIAVAVVFKDALMGIVTDVMGNLSDTITDLGTP